MLSALARHQRQSLGPCGPRNAALKVLPIHVQGLTRQVKRRNEPVFIASAAATATAVTTAGGDLAQVENGEGQHQFRGAVWVADLLPSLHVISTYDEEDEVCSVSTASDNDHDDCTSIDDLPQGYRTADRVALYNVPVRSKDGMLTMQPDPDVDSRDSQLVVCKVSQYRDDDGQVDWFKFAATLNEWQCFSKHADSLQSSHLVQLLGYSKSADSISIVSEFCSGGDLQQWMDGQHNTKSSTYHRNCTSTSGTTPAHDIVLYTDSSDQPELPLTQLPIATTPVHSTAAPELSSSTSSAHTTQCGSSSCQAHDIAVSASTSNLHQHHLQHSKEGSVTGTPWRVMGLWVQSAAGLIGRALVHNRGLGSLVSQKHMLNTALAAVPSRLEHRHGRGHTCKECSARYCLAGVKAEEWVEPHDLELSCVWPRAEVQGLSAAAAAGLVDGQVSTMRMTEAQVAHVALHVVMGLVTLHKAGLTHGDIKPANVFISPIHTASASSEGHCMGDTDVFKLGDFGTLREKGRKHLHYFVSGFGYTPEYASPEALRHGTAHASCSSDLWSLGVMMQQMLLGRLPSTAMAMAGLHETGTAHECETYLRKHPPACAALRELADANVPVSPALEQVLRSCLQVSASDRPVDAMALMRMDWFTSGMGHLVEQVLERQKGRVFATALSYN